MFRPEAFRAYIFVEGALWRGKLGKRMAVRSAFGVIRSRADGMVVIKARGNSLTRECCSAGTESDEELQVSEKWLYKRYSCVRGVVESADLIRARPGVTSRCKQKGEDKIRLVQVSPGNRTNNSVAARGGRKAQKVEANAVGKQGSEKVVVRWYGRAQGWECGSNK